MRLLTVCITDIFLYRIPVVCQILVEEIIFIIIFSLEIFARWWATGSQGRPAGERNGIFQQLLFW
jgi:hypothetical protein